MAKSSNSDPFPVSREFLTWAESIAGLLTKVETEYGGVAEMLESHLWESGKTPYAIMLVGAISEHLIAIHTEMLSHVEGKMQ